MIEFLSDIDTQLLLFFNGIHSPFWDYFMSAFTGKVIWVPMYASILYTAQEFSLESGFVLCGSDRPHYHVCRSDVQ